MNCRSCKTRIPVGKSICPHCGQVERTASFASRLEAGNGTTAGGLGPLSPSTLLDPNIAPLAPVKPVAPAEARPVVAPVERSQTGEAVRRPGNAAPVPRALERPRSPARVASAVQPTRPAKQATPARPAPRGASSTLPDRTLRSVVEPGVLRRLITAEPELVEPGLSIYEDESGTLAGVGFMTDVGVIDLLARDARDGFVLVMVPQRPFSVACLQGLLQRASWVGTHLSDKSGPAALEAPATREKGRRAVRCIVLVDELDDAVREAARVARDRIEFRAWRLSLCLEPIDLA